MNKFVFFGGKGGVGKTTSSSSYAYKCAKSGLKTLLVSTDPAHSTSDIFERDIGPDAVEIRKNLFAMEIDPKRESEDYIKRIKANMSKTISPVIIKEVEKQLDAASVSPGAEESALFDKLVEIVNSYKDDYEKIVFDTAPTGHTLRLLSLPELLGGWLDKLIEKRKKAVELMDMAYREKKLESDPVIEILTSRKEKFEKARSVLIDRKMISFVFVLNPERLPIEETKKAVSVLEKYRIPVEDIVVNKILPDDLCDDFWIERKRLEDGYIRQIEEIFGQKNIIRIPLLRSDVMVDDIERIAGFFE